MSSLKTTAYTHYDKQFSNECKHFESLAVYSHTLLTFRLRLTHTSQHPHEITCETRSSHIQGHNACISDATSWPTHLLTHLTSTSPAASSDSFVIRHTGKQLADSLCQPEVCRRRHCGHQRHVEKMSIAISRPIIDDGGYKTYGTNETLLN